MLRDWENEGGVDYHLGVAQRTARAAIDELGETDGAALQESFDQLPAAAQTQVFRYLAVENGGSVRPASETAMQQFGSTEEGAQLISEWGRHAARNVAVVKQRMGLMLRGRSMTGPGPSSGSTRSPRRKPRPCCGRSRVSNLADQ